MTKQARPHCHSIGYLDKSITDYGYFGTLTLEAVNNYKYDNALWNTEINGIDYTGLVGNTTWESLGLPFDVTKDIYYTTIRALYSEVLVYFNDYNKNMWSASIPFFYEMVRNGGTLDLKNQGWDDKYYIFNNVIVANDGPGNIAYGIAGTLLGIPEEVLYGAAGYAQLVAGTSNEKWITTYYDDPRDARFIGLGIEYVKSLSN